MGLPPSGGFCDTCHPTSAWAVDAGLAPAAPATPSAQARLSNPQAAREQREQKNLQPTT